MERVEKLKELICLCFGTGFVYIKAITESGEIIKGGSCYLFHKQVLTVSLADSKWLDDHGKPYNFRMVGKVMFIKNIAIGFGSSKNW